MRLQIASLSETFSRLLYFIFLCGNCLVKPRQINNVYMNVYQNKQYKLIVLKDDYEILI